MTNPTLAKITIALAFSVAPVAYFAFRPVEAPPQPLAYYQPAPAPPQPLDLRENVIVVEEQVVVGQAPAKKAKPKRKLVVKKRKLLVGPDTDQANPSHVTEWYYEGASAIEDRGAASLKLGPERESKKK